MMSDELMSLILYEISTAFKWYWSKSCVEKQNESGTQLIRFDDKSDEKGNGFVMGALNGFRCLAFDHESSWIEDMLNGMDEGIDEFFAVRRS